MRDVLKGIAIGIILGIIFGIAYPWHKLMAWPGHHETLDISLRLVIGSVAGGLVGLLVQIIFKANTYVPAGAIIGIISAFIYIITSLITAWDVEHHPGYQLGITFTHCLFFPLILLASMVAGGVVGQITEWGARIPGIVRKF